MTSRRKQSATTVPEEIAELSDENLDELLGCVPKTIEKNSRERLRKSVSRAIADKNRLRYDSQNFTLNATLEANLASLRRDLSKANGLLKGYPGLIACLNCDADLCADDPDLGFELIFDPDPAKECSVRGRNLVSMTLKGMGMLAALTMRSQKRIATLRGTDGVRTQNEMVPSTARRGGNNHQPHLMFFAFALNEIFKEIFGSDRRLNGMTYNETTDRGSPLVEFVRCCSRLAGENDDGNAIKQRLIALRKKIKAANGFPIQF